MNIGKIELAVGAPDAERLLASTGCTPAAMHDLLGAPVIAGTVAAALLACATGKKLPDRHELACAIAAEDVNEVREQVRALYAKAASAAGERSPRGQANA